MAVALFPPLTQPPMSILTILLVLVVVGVVLWLATTYIPMPADYKRFLVIAVIVLLCVWLLRVSGLLGSLGGVRVG